MLVHISHLLGDWFTHFVCCIAIIQASNEIYHCSRTLVFRSCKLYCRFPKDFVAPLTMEETNAGLQKNHRELKHFCESETCVGILMEG